MINIKEIDEIIDRAKCGQYKVCIWGAGYVGRTQGYKMLTELGIKIDFYCDNNSELYGQEIIDGIICINPKNIPQNAICFIMTSGHLVYEIKEQLKYYVINDNIVTYMQLCEYKSKNYFECQKKNQIAIYTCIVGGYDEVKEPDEIIPNCDYYLISDKEKKESSYQYISIDNFEECKELDDARKNRYCKINAHKIFPNYRYSIYFDGNFILYKEITKYIERLPKTKIIMLGRTGYNSVYAEAYRCMLHKRDDENKFIKQVEKYWNEGMPDDFGLLMPGLMIRQHNHSTCKKIMEEWWDEVLKYSRRDMISLPYVLWKNGYSIDDVNVCSKLPDMMDGEGWEFVRNHKKSRI